MSSADAGPGTRRWGRDGGGLPLAWQRLGKAGQISSRVANRKTQQGLGVAEVSDGKIMRSAGVMHCEISRGITSAAHPAWPRLVGRGEKITLALLQRRTDSAVLLACGSGFRKMRFSVDVTTPYSRSLRREADPTVRVTK